MPTNSTLGVGVMKRHDKYYIRDGNICFLVDNTVFRLHRFFFERESDYFRDRLGPSSEGEDGSLDSPYIIRDVKCDDFADLVWVWYNPQYSFSKQTKQKWLTILKLATLWRFDEIKRLAVRELEKMKFEPIEKITLYKQYNVDSELLLPSYVSLCTSPTLPSPEEGERLTLKTVLQLASARERVLLRAAEVGCKTPTIADAPSDIVKATVSELFGLTFHLTNDQGVMVEGQATNNRNASGEMPWDAEVVTVKQPMPFKKGNVNDAAASPLVNGVGGKGKHKATS